MIRAFILSLLGASMMNGLGWNMDASLFSPTPLVEKTFAVENSLADREVMTEECGDSDASADETVLPVGETVDPSSLYGLTVIATVANLIQHGTRPFVNGVGCSPRGPPV